jgi:hypothetical protein
MEKYDVRFYRGEDLAIGDMLGKMADPEYQYLLKRKQDAVIMLNKEFNEELKKENQNDERLSNLATAINELGYKVEFD